MRAFQIQIRSEDVSRKFGLVLRRTYYFLLSCRQNGSDSRFTVILDRRLDTWSSLKISLQKISVSTNLFLFFFCIIPTFFGGGVKIILILMKTIKIDGVGRLESREKSW